jgi:hypothetical protein
MDGPADPKFINTKQAGDIYKAAAAAAAVFDRLLMMGIRFLETC